VLRIKYERLRRGWNQIALAYNAAMSVGDISRIESGRLRPYPSQVEKLATLLGVHSDELLQEVKGEHVAMRPEPPPPAA